MRITELLIEQIRRQTENTNPLSIDDAITDDEIIQYLNDAQERIESLIVRQHNSIFAKEVLYDVVRHKEVYELPIDTYINRYIVSIEYAQNGRADYFDKLQRAVMAQRTSIDGYPCQYIPRSNEIIINPIPDNSVAGGFRITYNPRHPGLDKRRGVINTAEVNDTSKKIISLSLQVNDLFNSEDFNNIDYICFVDRYGNSNMRAIPIIEVQDDGTVIVDPDFTFQDGENLTGYVVRGKFATTHSQLPHNCEKYLLAYGAWKIFKRDSSTDSTEQQRELSAIESDIVDSFAQDNGDVQGIPIINNEFRW